MVYFVYTGDCELESGKEFRKSLATCEGILDEEWDEDLVQAALEEEPEGLGESKSAAELGRGRQVGREKGRTTTKRVVTGKNREKAGHGWIPAATKFAELSLSERRLGNEAIKAICDRGKTHNRLLGKARASVDTSEPKTRKINKWHEKLKSRDPMPELDLPKDIKLHSSWQQLAEMKWRKDWHERLMSRTKSNLDTHLPRHVKIYQKRKQQELRKLLQPQAF